MIDPDFNIKVPVGSEKSSTHPNISSKLIVPRGWDDSSRHIREYNL
jgi:hypothetical protein